MKMAIGVLLLLIVSAAYVEAQEPPEAVRCSPVEKIIDSVPPHPQETTSWCWVASAEMIMDFWKRPLSQCNQVTDYYREELTDANIRSCCDKENGKDNKYLDECNLGGLPAFWEYSFNAEVIRKLKGIPWTTLTQEIDQGRPVAAGVKLNGGGRHMVVVNGYRIVDGCDKWVKYMDPCGSNDENTGECKVSQDELSLGKFGGIPGGLIESHLEDFINIFPLP